MAKNTHYCKCPFDNGFECLGSCKDKDGEIRCLILKNTNFYFKKECPFFRPKEDKDFIIWREEAFRMLELKKQNLMLTAKEKEEL